MKSVIIIGGGAAGYFTAINTAEMAKKNDVKISVKILESSAQVLKKVRISGGGRCNVTHNLFDISAFCSCYPRGSKELLSPFKKFQALDTVEWFKARGVNLVAEEDGRMFPETNSSQTIIECFLASAKNSGVELLVNHKVEKIKKLNNDQFEVKILNNPSLNSDVVMIATGSSSTGYFLAKSLGHSITELAPSLFSFNINDALIKDLPGLSFESAYIKLIIGEKNSFSEKGSILITHWGLSGPSILKISAWSAREMKSSNYQGILKVNWLGLNNLAEVTNILKYTKELGKKSQIQNIYPEMISYRFWIKILEKADVPLDLRWADISNQQIKRISHALFNTELTIVGKNRYKDELVECGGVKLSEVDFKTMQSKICPGLYFAGEVLDIDGITGGFNFQNAWTGAWIAAQSLSHKKIYKN